MLDEKKIKEVLALEKQRDELLAQAKALDIKIKKLSKEVMGDFIERSIINSLWENNQYKRGRLNPLFFIAFRLTNYPVSSSLPKSSPTMRSPTLKPPPTSTTIASACDIPYSPQTYLHSLVRLL